LCEFRTGQEPSLRRREGALAGSANSRGRLHSPRETCLGVTSDELHELHMKHQQPEQRQPPLRNGSGSGTTTGGIARAGAYRRKEEDAAARLLSVIRPRASTKSSPPIVRRLFLDRASREVRVQPTASQREKDSGLTRAA